jgi:uncharacterized protein YrrD
VAFLCASDIEGQPLTGAADAELGTVERLLFHPSENRVIGAVVRPPAALLVMTRPETFLPYSALSFQVDGVATETKKLPTQRQAAGPLGFNPDLTVIWMSMPVMGPASEQIGLVSDIEFDAETGEVNRIEVAAGAIADAAHGRFIVPASKVLGYDRGAVRISTEAAGLVASGGFAKSAARTAIVVSQTAAAVGAAVGDSVVAASGAAGRAIKAVADSNIAEKAAARVKGTWRDTVKAFREGMKDDE